tara:strand:- start:831 stop:1040 length:210 start_codon:yes stop_codon:yes gene_type:complete
LYAFEVSQQTHWKQSALRFHRAGIFCLTSFYDSQEPKTALRHLINVNKEKLHYHYRFGVQRLAPELREN